MQRFTETQTQWWRGGQGTVVRAFPLVEDRAFTLDGLRERPAQRTLMPTARIFQLHAGEADVHAERRGVLSLRRGTHERRRCVDGQPGDQQAQREAATDVLDVAHNVHQIRTRVLVGHAAESSRALLRSVGSNAHFWSNGGAFGLRLSVTVPSQRGKQRVGGDLPPSKGSSCDE